MLRCFIVFVMLCSAAMADQTFTITIEAGEVDRENSPVMVPITLEQEFKQPIVMLSSDDGTKTTGQITSGSLATNNTERHNAELHFILPQLPSGKQASFKAVIREAEQVSDRSATFQWVDTSKPKGDGDVYAEQSRELRLGDRPVLRYMYSALDEATKESREATYKPYHHVYDPTGNRLVTKGPGGLFPHHRGLYYGFNKVSYGPEGKQQVDVWHCTTGDQVHVEFLAEEAGPVLGRHAVRIHWRGKDKQPFASEVRELTAYNVPGGVLIQFASRLENATEHEVRLDGDPQHAGFHFRAAQEVPDKTAKQTYYLRPDGRAEPGKFRNWPGDKQHVNLPWNALSFVLGDQRYTCCYLDHPENPKESRFSERDYGRFGSYFEHVLRKEPLGVKYRVWLQAGELEVEQVQGLDDDFVQPVVATVK